MYRSLVRLGWVAVVCVVLHVGRGMPAAQPTGTGQDGVDVLVMFPGGGGQRCTEELNSWLYSTVGKSTIHCTSHPFVGGIQEERSILAVAGSGVYPYVTMTENDDLFLESAVIIPDAEVDRIESLVVVADGERRTIRPQQTMRMDIYDSVLQIATFRVHSDVLDPGFLSDLVTAADKRVVYSVATKKGTKEKSIKLNKKNVRAIQDALKVYEAFLSGN